VILKTQLSYWFFHRTLALYFIVALLGGAIGFASGPVTGVAVEFGLIILFSIWVWLSYAELENVTIDKEAEWIEIRDAMYKIVLSASLKDITDMEWENKNVIYNSPRFQQRATNKKSFVVTFKNGYEWYAEGSDYKNYFEIQGYLLTYCAKHQIIKIRPLEERKRASVRKRKRRLSR